MYYDPIKNIFASAIKKIPFLRIVFYKILDVMFLRSWYVRRELKEIRMEQDKRKAISVYDAGTGYGQYSYFIARRLNPVNIYAVDVKEAWINDCREFFKKYRMGNVIFNVEDLTTISHISRFDLIVCVDVMEHIEEDTTVFQNFYRALNPGGYLVINTPSIFGGSDVHDDSDESFISEHARDGYSAEDLKNKLEPIGFSIVRHRYSYGFWGDKSWRLAIKTPMKLLNFSKLFFIIIPVYFLITFPVFITFMYIDYKIHNRTGSGITLVAKKN